MHRCHPELPLGGEGSMQFAVHKSFAALSMTGLVGSPWHDIASTMSGLNPIEQVSLMSHRAGFHRSGQVKHFSRTTLTSIFFEKRKQGRLRGMRLEGSDFRFQVIPNIDHCSLRW